MKSTLIMAIIYAIVAVAMVVCIIFDIAMANWPALIICTIGLLLNVRNTICYFRLWRIQRAEYNDLDN